MQWSLRKRGEAGQLRLGESGWRNQGEKEPREEEAQEASNSFSEILVWSGHPAQAFCLPSSCIPLASSHRHPAAGTTQPGLHKMCDHRCWRALVRGCMPRTQLQPLGLELICLAEDSMNWSTAISPLVLSAQPSPEADNGAGLAGYPPAQGSAQALRTPQRNGDMGNLRVEEEHTSFSKERLDHIFPRTVNSLCLQSLIRAYYKNIYVSAS
ncbi:uncharacterized protein LOC102954557 [Panthera tigris]|uniref:uncharacterized protein LOC102954557 n=1 Tax=Panthera tigris TaxID=9694 RepID=UPI001C6F9EA4|nr:uncharacterized protein LOC102954557 [Panthera tigris]